jgi:hypothetical protein
MAMTANVRLLGHRQKGREAGWLAARDVGSARSGAQSSIGRQSFDCRWDGRSLNGKGYQKGFFFLCGLVGCKDFSKPRSFNAIFSSLKNFIIFGTAMKAAAGR